MRGVEMVRWVTAGRVNHSGSSIHPRVRRRGCAAKRRLRSAAPAGRVVVGLRGGRVRVRCTLHDVLRRRTAVRPSSLTHNGYPDPRRPSASCRRLLEPGRRRACTSRLEVRREGRCRWIRRARGRPERDTTHEWVQSRPSDVRAVGPPRGDPRVPRMCRWLHLRPLPELTRDQRVRRHPLRRPRSAPTTGRARDAGHRGLHRPSARKRPRRPKRWPIRGLRSVDAPAVPIVHTRKCARRRRNTDHVLSLPAASRDLCLATVTDQLARAGNP